MREYADREQNDDAGKTRQAEQAESPERTPETLAHSEMRYRRLFEAARDGILLLDVRTGRITDANPFMTELLGYPHDELLGKELWQIGLFADKDTSRAAFAHLQKHGYIRYEDLPLETRRGERREVEFVSNVYRENRHEVIQCNIRDITERKWMEKALEASGEALQVALARERHITDFLQRPLTQEVAEDAFPGLSVAALYEPALAEAQVGGDFFDAFSLVNGRGGTLVALTVGDVAGKGLLAAALAGRVKDVTRAFLRENHDPARTLSRLNEYLCDAVSNGSKSNDSDSSKALVVLSLAVIAPRTGRATVSSAGAEPPALLRAGGGVEVIDAGGALLGVARNAVYESATLHLHPGDTVLLMTDGLTEARRPSEGPEGEAAPEFLGYEAVVELAQSSVSAPSVREMGEKLLEGARAFGGSFRDDVCLLLARCR